MSIQWASKIPLGKTHLKVTRIILTTIIAAIPIPQTKIRTPNILRQNLDILAVINNKTIGITFSWDKERQNHLWLRKAFNSKCKETTYSLSSVPYVKNPMVSSRIICGHLECMLLQDSLIVLDVVNLAIGSSSRNFSEEEEHNIKISTINTSNRDNSSNKDNSSNRDTMVVFKINKEIKGNFSQMKWTHKSQINMTL
jgi:hypothetical protein